MIKLNINPAVTDNLATAVGITKERYDELMVKLDEEAQKRKEEAEEADEDYKLFIHTEWIWIAEFCNTTEELVLCVHTHTKWLMYSGRLVDLQE